MGAAYKNIWSLNTDEAIIAGILRNASKKDVEVLMPLNAQMKDIDLVLINVKNKKSLTIQVKGSRAYESSNKSLEKYKHGSVGWFFLDANKVLKSNADFFVFLVYVIEENLKIGRRSLNPHTLTIPTIKLQELTKKYKKKTGNRYSYYFWINPKSKKAFDIRDNNYSVSRYLDKSGFSLLNKKLN